MLLREGVSGARREEQSPLSSREAEALRGMRDGGQDHLSHPSGAGDLLRLRLGWREAPRAPASRASRADLVGVAGALTSSPGETVHLLLLSSSSTRERATRFDRPGRLVSGGAQRWDEARAVRCSAMARGIGASRSRHWEPTQAGLNVAEPGIWRWREGSHAHLERAIHRGLHPLPTLRVPE